MANRVVYILILGVAFLVMDSTPSLALAVTDDLNDIARRLVNSSNRIPGLVSAVSYLFGLLIGVTAVLKLKEHVENPTQTPIRIAIIRFIAGGALLSLPIVLQAVTVSIGTQATFSQNGNLATAFSGIFSFIGAFIPFTGINEILGKIILSTRSLPGAVSAVAYLLGLIMVVAGILKTKDHVENPDQNPLREGVARLLTGGALFALPTMYSAMESLITGNGASILTTLTSLLPTAGYFFSPYAPATASSCLVILGASPTSLGGSMCQFIGMSAGFPAFFASISYLFGLIVGLWAILKIRDHVLNPQQIAIWEGISRLVVAGAFFSFPYVVEVMRSSVTPFGISLFGFGGLSSGYRHESYVAAQCALGGPVSLDVTMACAMRNVMAPIQALLNHFTYIAGMIFIMIGISRLMKSAQDGARGPGGMGTWATFFIGGILLSYNTILQAVSQSFFATGLGTVDTQAVLSYTAGMTTGAGSEVAHVEIVIQTVIQFMIVVGLISFVRGWFIIRDVAEGNQQASMMAGTTHIIGGALAVNLGPLLNAVQTTLGVTGVGVQFS